ncbi:MAG TPA: PDZ domain-containing protein [Gemmatimonadales bacterium]|nr:PDZ domain-containing protein [Gemmatimonadales bacterium]
MLALLALATPAAAQGTRLLRQPTVSATQIAFAYAGDLWITGRDGGDARRLTSAPGIEGDPQFSPDGKLVAFTGEYASNFDVYVVDASGGTPRRLTWHPGGDFVRGWTPDGKAIVFATNRENPRKDGQRFWSVPVAGGLEQPLALPEANHGMFSPDGKRIVYERTTPWDQEWRNYRGGQNQPIQIFTLAGAGVEKLPWEGSKDMWPVWLGDAIYFISDRDWAGNVWRYDLGKRQLSQVTHHRDYDVKTLAAGGGVLVYEQAGYLHLLDPASGRDRQLVINVRGELPWTAPRWVDAARNANAASLSPTGVRAVIEARGEIFTVPAEKGDVRNLTRSPGAADHAPVWSPDGKRIAWFSDASGEYRLMIGTQDGLEKPREIVLDKPTYYYDPAWSPDGKSLAFTDAGRNLWVVDVASGKATRADGDNYAHPERTLVPVWSPDSRWLAYAKRLTTQFRALMVYSLADGKARQLTDGLSDAGSPAWDASGKYLYFLASTDYGLGSGWLDLSSYDRKIRQAVYLAVLSADTPSPLLPESDEETAKDTAAKKDSLPRGADTTRVRIDFNGLGQRVLDLGLPVRSYTQLEAGGAGVLFLTEAVENQDGVTLHRYDLKKRKSESFLTGVSLFSLSQDGKKLLYRAGKDWAIVGTETAPKPGDGRIAVDLPMRLDPSAEWHQIFREAWRFQRDYLYVPNHHGADLDLVYRMYAPWVDHVAHRADLTYLLDILGGEFSVGHSFTGGGDVPTSPSDKVGLLGADLVRDGERYRLSRIYDGEEWNPGLAAPLRAPGVKARAGDYLIAVNGVELKAPVNPYSLFEGTAGRQTVLRLNDKPTAEGSWTATIVPVAKDDGLRTQAWVEGNRRLVDSLSGGKLAYVWIPNTAEDGYTYFNRYYFAQQNRQGVILDERFNHGGYIADYIVDLLNRNLRGYFNNPVGERRPWTEPLTGIFGPKVMVVNEYAGSGGDMLPYLFRHLKLGPLVGAKTWGGLVGIWDVPGLIDDGYITAPRGGFFNVDGQWDVENVGVAPDIAVEQTPAELLKGRDPQLERAVQEALRLLADHPVQLKAEPAPPVRVRRP